MTKFNFGFNSVLFFLMKNLFLYVSSVNSDTDKFNAWFEIDNKPLTYFDEQIAFQGEYNITIFTCSYLIFLELQCYKWSLFLSISILVNFCWYHRQFSCLFHLHFLVFLLRVFCFSFWVKIADVLGEWNCHL